MVSRVWRIELERLRQLGVDAKQGRRQRLEVGLAPERLDGLLNAGPALEVVARRLDVEVELVQQVERMLKLAADPVAAARPTSVQAEPDAIEDTWSSFSFST